MLKESAHHFAFHCFYSGQTVHFFDFGLRLEQQTVVGYCLLIQLALSYSPYNFRLSHDKPLRLLVQS